MNVVILAGGYGSRLGEYTIQTPKPMVKIGPKPILWHIMKHYDLYKNKNFYIALGYKSEVIKKYFLDFNLIDNNFTIDLNEGSVKTEGSKEDWRVSLIDTGINTMTGGRLKRMKPFLKNETFFMTYGDGLCDVNLDELLKFHKDHGRLVTVTAVHPSARFGELNFEGDYVNKFVEKPQTFQGWVNGGFFVMEPEVFEFLENDQTILEREPLEKIAQMGELVGFKHEGFWQCMDTKRDKDLLENLISRGITPWLNSI